MVIIVIGLLAGALFLIQQNLYIKWWNKGVEVRLAFEQDMIVAGETVRLYETLENRKWLPLSFIKVKFQCSKYLLFTDNSNAAVTDRYYRKDIFSIMSYKRIIRDHLICCRQRGYYTIYGIDLVGVDLLFSGEMIDSRESDALLYVVPAVKETQDLITAVQRINGEIITRRHDQEDPFTYRGIRDYEIYDGMKAVNWKATARTGDLKVNIKDHTSVSSVRIFINFEEGQILKHPELQEMGISICAYLLDVLLSQGIRVHLYANAKDHVTGQILFAEGNSDRNSLENLNKALARLDLTEPPEDFEGSFKEQLNSDENTIYTVFITSNRHKLFQRVLTDYTGKENYIWLCPVEEPEPDSILNELRSKVVFIPM